jgi:alpha-glucuronidase
MKRISLVRVVVLAGFLVQNWPAASLRADTGYDAWLRYALLSEVQRARYASFPTRVVTLGHSPLLKTSEAELIRGIRGMLQRTLSHDNETPKEPAVILGTLASVHSFAAGLPAPKSLRSDGYWLGTGRIHGQDCIIIAGEDDRGTLYGVFALLRKLAMAENLSHLQETQEPSAPVRWVNQWDNLDGSIERVAIKPSAK